MTKGLVLGVFLLCVWSVCAPLSPTHAQSAATGALAGTVTDTTGGVVAEAKVIVTRISTGEVRTIMSQPSGNYTVPLLPPGRYSIEASKSGFKTTQFPNVIVNVTETARLDIQLEVGPIAQKVTVTAQTQQLETTSPALGHVIAGDVVSDLPLVVRNYTQIVTLSPGVSAQLNDAGALGRGNGGIEGGINDEGMEVHGAANYDNNFQMNGVEVNDFLASANTGGVSIPNPDTIQEFKVQTGQYDASFGRNAGANVNVVTKGGSNQFHGTAFEFFRNEDLNANTFFRNLAGKSRPILRENQFGYTLGGPILKDKLTFFSSYQGTRQTNGLGSGLFACSSNFSEPPLTNDRSATALGALFAGQTGFFGGEAVAANGSNISPQALDILKLKLPDGSYVIPTPQTVDASKPFPVQGFSAFSSPCSFSENQFMINGDYLHSSKSKLSVRFFFANSNETATFPQSNVTGQVSAGFPLVATDQFRDVTVSHTYIFTSNLVNEAEFGFHRTVTDTVQHSPFLFSDIGVTSDVFSNVPNIAILGAFTMGGNGQSQSFAQNHFTAQDSLSYVHGRHTLRFGGGVTRVQQNIPLHLSSGILLFLSFNDFLLGTDGVTNGTGVSNVFIGAVLSGLFAREYRSWNGDSYIQDDFKVTSRLTLNLGFRYERLGAIADALGRNSGFDFALANPNPPAGGTLAGFTLPSNFSGAVPDGVVKTNNEFGILGKRQNTWGPRVGFAWQIPHSERFVLRGGYGIFYSRLPANISIQGLSAPPFGLAQIVQGASSPTFADPFPAPVPLSAFPMFTPYSPTTSLSPFEQAQTYQPSMVQQYSMNTQVQLAHDFVLEVGYVGTRGTHLVTTIGANQALLSSTANPIRGQTTNTVANIPLRVPIEGFSPNNFRLIETSAASWYNGLEVSLNKRISRGLQFLVSYTFSKNLAVDGANANSVATGSVSAFGNQDVPAARYGLSNFDHKQRLVVSYTYSFPGPAKLDSLAGRILGGWQIAGVTTIQTGQPLTLTGTNANNAFGITDDRAELAAGCSNAQVETPGSVTRKLNHYFNTSCVGPSVNWPIIGSDGQATAFGNSGIGIVRGPDQNNFDVALIKRTPLPWPNEVTNLEFRAEFFNFFNLPQFANPDTNVSSATFGQVQALSTNPRVVQFALKLNF